MAFILVQNVFMNVHTNYTNLYCFSMIIPIATAMEFLDSRFKLDWTLGYSRWANHFRRNGSKASVRELVNHVLETHSLLVCGHGFRARRQRQSIHASDQVLRRDT